MTTATVVDHPWPVYGHDWAVDFLRKGMQHGRTRQAYLITGPPSVGKTTFAHAFAMALNCTHDDPDARPCLSCRSCRLVMSGNHPDMLYSELDPNTGALRIETLRELMGRLALKPYEARTRVAIISDFDRARGPAQDAILKTLEEPPPHAILLLLADRAESMLSTILSRCQTIALRPVATETLADVLAARYGADAELATRLARFSGGRVGWAIAALGDPAVLEQRAAALDILEETLRKQRKGRFDLANDLSKDKLALPPLLELWLTYWRDALLLTENAPVKLCNIDRRVTLEQLAQRISADDARRALRATQATLKLLTTNTNPRLALEVMFLDYPGLR
jgi:DNA polymerase-3 subunit delta'